MALPRAGVSIGITINVGNYESVRAEANFARDVEPDESFEDAFADCVETCRQNLHSALDGVKDVLASVRNTSTQPRKTGGGR